MSTTAQPVGAAVQGARRRRRRHLSRYAYIAPAVIFVGATTIYPLYYNITLSLYDAPIQKFLNGTIEFIGLANYADALASPQLWAGLRVSLIYTVATIALMYVLGLALAVFFNRSFAGRNAIRAAIFLPYILPSVVAANVWRWILDGSYGLLNYALMSVGVIDEPVFWLGRGTSALVAVVLATAWTMAPFAMLLLLAGLQHIPRTIHEAAGLDGAGPWTRFRTITLPLLRPVSLVVALLGFIYTFRTFDTIFIMTKGGPGDATTVLPVLAYNEAFVRYELGSGSAINTLMLVIPTVLALLYFRATKREEVL